MAGLEVLYTCVAGSLTSPQDALVCFVHWEMIKSGYRCIGSGDEPCSGDRKSELLPADWSSNKELYSLRYEAVDSDAKVLLKAIAVDSALIFNLMNCSTQQVADLTVNVKDHVNADHLDTFDRVFINGESLSEKVKAQLLPPREKADGEESREEESAGGGRRGRRKEEERRTRPSTHSQQTSQYGNAASMA
ncbi:Proteasome inhibitor PI31 subunit [Oryzias melastigma]|uniref:Proteasome inhibitor PI31 subunit n=1 Tax=Oryzias melastigma TaxID=30732 RepID=A0A834C8T5_ORYME|nr:Proteasome inhibitor PI31 subunit [Oryzias melastigma]